MSYDIAFQAKVIGILRGLISSTLASACSGRCYWQVAPQEAVMPYVVFQSQDGGGKRDDYVGANGWKGLVTLRVIDTDQDVADALLVQLPALLQGLSSQGYSFTFVPGRALVVPPEEYPDSFIYTAALIGEASFS